MTSGFHVNLAELGQYTDALVESQQNYAAIEEQLTQADLTTADPNFTTLLGRPEYCGSATELQTSCISFLTTYRNLYTEIHALHKQISQKLNFMVEEFVNTHQLYQELENKNQNRYTSLMGRFDGGDHGGTTGA